MFKSKRYLIGAALIAALSLTACSATKAPAAPAAEQKAVSIADGVQKMLRELDELKDDIEKGDAAKAKEHANEVHEAWESFEDGVKAKDKAMYEQIEEPLGALVSGTKDGKSLDKKVLSEQANKLESLLKQLAK
jgi:iron uptake system EfeUOB component EfeO/EfeM